MDFSIILPVKDPEPYLGSLLHQVYAVLQMVELLYGLEGEVLIQKELGLTNAVLEGVKRAQGSWIGVMDSDGSHNPLDLFSMLCFLVRNPDLDIIIGVKKQDESGVFRKLVSKGFAVITNIILRTRLKDLSGFLIARKELFSVVKPSLDFKFILPLVYLNPQACIYQYGIIFEKRKGGVSKANMRQAGLILLQLFKLKTKKY